MIKMILPLALVILIGVASAFQGRLFLDPATAYNDAAEEVYTSVKGVGDAYQKLALAANAFGKERNRRRIVLDVSGKEVPVLPQLLDQVKAQADNLQRATHDLQEAIVEYQERLDWLEYKGELYDAESYPYHQDE